MRCVWLATLLFVLRSNEYLRHRRNTRDHGRSRDLRIELSVDNDRNHRIHRRLHYPTDTGYRDYDTDSASHRVHDTDAGVTVCVSQPDHGCDLFVSHSCTSVRERGWYDCNICRVDLHSSLLQSIRWSAGTTGIAGNLRRSGRSWTAGRPGTGWCAGTDATHGL